MSSEQRCGSELLLGNLLLHCAVGERVGHYEQACGPLEENWLLRPIHHAWVGSARIEWPVSKR